MHFSKIAVAASAMGMASAATMSICDKYTTALLKENTGANQYTLLTLLINTGVIGNFTGPGTTNSKLPGSMVNVPGILAPKATYKGQDATLLQYFDGSLVSTNRGGMPAAVNFLDGGGAKPLIADPTSSGTVGSNQYTLLTHLYSFFGALLGCSEYGKTGFPAYAGDNSQYSVHQYMDLNEAQFGYFIEQVGLAAASFGVTQADITTAAGALNSGFGMRCAPAVAVIPGSSAELQAICVDTSCPEATSAVCASYSAESDPATVSATGAASATATATGSAVGEMTDGQPTVTAIASSGVGEKTDGQPTATTIAPSLYTGAAAHPTAAVLAGAAALAAFAL